MDLGFADKTALVLGAGSTIGAAVAERLVAEGAAVTIVDTCARPLDDLVARLSGVGGVVQSVLIEPGSEYELPAQVTEWRGGFQFAWIGGLLGASSIVGAARLMDMTADHLAAQGGGSIVVQSTTAGSWDVPEASAAYAAMGAALIQLARQVGVRRAGDGVRVNAICPGGIQDPDGASVIDAPHVSLAEPAPASDVAEVAAFLLSPLSSYTTAQAIVIDGGASII
ncbi:SDR family NAD(P)-dependent oxidoreductase [Microbacterium sp. A93]|uniref:SDR family NAD(P)-dependent oxidoreductase n=1 Tax=Microbacterium sp. A93 TaxID=3450716 RepID=UPI003F423809